MITCEYIKVRQHLEGRIYKFSIDLEGLDFMIISCIMITSVQIFIKIVFVKKETGNLPVAIHCVISLFKFQLNDYNHI